MATRTPSCEHCGSPCREHTFVFPDDDRNPTFILDDIKRLDRAIQRLRTLKSQRYEQLNSVRSSTKILPNEILLSIFHFFCSLFQSRKFPQFILGGVCTHWRDLLNTEPVFWKTIDLSIGDWSASRAASLLEVFKERNGASFELMQLRFEKLRDQARASQQLLLPVGGVSTISKIVLRDTPVDFLQMKDTGLEVHDVSLMGLARGTSMFRWIILESSPPWSTLTVLTLSRIPINFCCDLLLGCSNLIQFTIYEAYAPIGRTGPNARQAQETYFPHIQQLAWYHGHSAWDDNFLSFYRFPALQGFRWSGFGCSHSIPLFREFTSFLPQSCRIFQLSGPQEYDVGLPREILLQMVHPVERLICTRFHVGDLGIAIDMLQDQTFIPSLRSFRWKCTVPYRLTEDKFIETIQYIEGARRGRTKIGAGRFRIEIEGVEFPEVFSREEASSYMGGFDFEITRDGGWIISF
jgi:hypothetical protein